jgi:hypothetical protein
MRLWVMLLAIWPALANAGELAAGMAGRVLLDGRCEADEWARAGRLDLGRGATLLMQETTEDVFLCLRGPAGGLNTLDLYVVSPRAPTPADLHVSAQVGERVLTPAGWPDWQWRNQQGWYGTQVPFAGVTTVDGQMRPDFATGTDRELQLSKARFGPLPWRVRVELRTMGADRKGSVIYPDGTKAEDPTGWLVLTPARS